MNESWHAHEGLALAQVLWLIRMCDITPSYACHDSFICVTWLVLMCAMTHTSVCVLWLMRAVAKHGRRVVLAQVPWLIHMCAMTLSYVWHDPSICAMTHSYVWHDPSMCVPWLIHMCDMTRSYQSNTWCVYVRRSSHVYIYIRVMSQIWMSLWFRVLLTNIAYVVATVSRIDKRIGLFCRIWSLLQGSFAKETYNSCMWEDLLTYIYIYEVVCVNVKRRKVNRCMYTWCVHAKKKSFNKYIYMR